MMLRRLPLLLCLVLGSSATWAQTPPEAGADTQQAQAQAAREQARSQDFERIARERSTLEQLRLQGEKACYQRFAVNDCLAEVRAQDRHARTLLRQQEQVLRDQERQETTAARLRSVQDKQQQASERAANARPEVRQPSVSPEERTEREAQARERAARQRAHVQDKAAAQAERAAGAPAQEAQARKAYEDKQQQAQQRRDKRESQRAQDAAAGVQPAAGLPAPEEP